MTQFKLLIYSYVKKVISQKKKRERKQEKKREGNEHDANNTIVFI